ncbi:MAG TPA: carbohydrate kinase [Verrucomicrobiae bacterium]|nr:carbohydrate kinase [Verrucomicrobiae bacterium]
MSFKVIGLGEVLWDVLPSGLQLGGAPANFACHARQLGADVQVITRVGRDAPGRRVLERFREMEIETATVQVDDQLPTGTAGVALDADGTPRFTIHDNVAWDALAFTEEALAAARGADALCFGTLAQRTRAAAAVIQRLVTAAPAAAWRVFDINLRQDACERGTIERSLEAANVLKLNDHELAVLSPRFDLTGDSRQRIEQLAARFDLQLVALTRAERGSLLYRPGQWSELPGRRFAVVDTVGAGDAFAAALVMGLLHQLPLADIHRHAADVACHVCACPGATPLLPPSLRSAFGAHAKTTG